MKDLKVEIAVGMGKERTKIIEEYLKLAIRPKPVWMPFFLYKWLLKRLVYLEVIK